MAPPAGTKEVNVDVHTRSLRYLLQVVDTGHFGRAAASLYITPSALTQQIRKLESQLGVVLLEREGHPILPTRAGSAYVAEARAAIEAMDRAHARISAIGRDQTSTLRVGFVVNLFGPLSQLILDGFAAAAPEAVLELVELPMCEQVEAVMTGAADVSIARGPVRHPAATVLPVLSEPRTILMRPSHRLADRESLVLADLRDEVIVRAADDLVDEHWARWWPVDPRPDGSAIRYGPTVHSVGELRAAVASGRAIAFVAHSLAEELARGELTFVPVTDISPSTVHLCLPPDPSALALRFAEVATRLARL
jgi:DNA-binding transcriptional LysR family regulator